MQVKVTEKDVNITELSQVNHGEYNVNECEFILPETFDELCVMAVFNHIPVPVINSRCLVPTLESGNCVLGVYAYRQSVGETEVMYSPKPTVFYVENGSFTEERREEKIPELFDFEKYCARLYENWNQLIKENVLPGFTENATEMQFYSAKAINEIAQRIQGDVDAVSALVGGV